MFAKRTSGFTLIELMIVVAIIAVLASIAYPSYQDQIRKSRRADAKAALMENQHWMERNFSISGRYDRKSDGSVITDADLPAPVSPEDGTAYYALTFSAGPNTSSYTIQAAPQNGQEADTKCGTITLNQLGAKGKSGTGTVAECW